MEEAAGSGATPALGDAGAQTDRMRLVHSVYRIALEPHAYDAFMDDWQAVVGEALESLSNLQQENSSIEDPELLAHFATAFDILEELGRRSPAPRDGQGPRLVIDAGGAVVWCNGAATRLFEVQHPARVSNLRPHLHNPETLDHLLDQVRRERDGPAGSRRILRLARGGGSQFLLARTLLERGGRRVILVEPLVGEWTPEAGQLLVETFGFTSAETAVASLLAEGLSASDIAARRGVSILTVRAQIRAILAKSGADGQADLVRLLLSVLRLAEDGRPAADSLPAEKVFAISADRRIPVVEMGDPEGAPVLFMHGMLDGCSATPLMDRALRGNRLRLIAPVRPDFGSADPDTGPPATAARRFAVDVEQLADRLGLEHLPVIGHMAGALHAFAVAERMGARICAVINVAGTVPIVSPRQFAVMSRRQRLVAYTARYVPAALPFVLRAGIRQLDYDGAANFMSALYETSPPDLALAADPDVFRSLRRGYRFTVAQGHRAFETDGYQVVRDWTALAEGSDVPVTLVHGSLDPVVGVEAVAAFALRLGPRARLRVMEGLGQLVLYATPQTVFGLAAAALRR